MAIQSADHEIARKGRKREKEKEKRLGEKRKGRVK